MPAPGDQHRATNVATNPFEEPENRVSLYTAEQVATLQARLNKFLGPEYISSRDGPGGKKVHYIAAVQCIQLANEVFGFNGWSSQIREVQVDYVEEVGNTGKFNMAASVVMRVTLRDGTFHEDIGYGQIENCKSKAMGFEKAKKEATTDALKRALRNFGNVLGNCIYDKDYVGKVTKIKVKPRKFDLEELHRHADYIIAKPEIQHALEAPAPIATEQEAPRRTEAAVPRSRSAVEDEFDTADFDDVDFSVADDGHPDEVIVDEPVVSNHFGPNNGVTRSNQNGVQRTSSNNRGPTAQTQQRLPASRNGLHSVNPANQGYSQAAGGAASNHQSNNPAAGRPSFPPPQQSNTNTSPTRTAQNQSMNPPGRAASNALNTNPPNFTDISTEPSLNPEQASTNAAPPIPPDGPILFVSARAAGALQSANASELAPTAVFNPHADSPSIRKTAGVDHSKSMKLKRDLLPYKEDSPTAPTQSLPRNPNMEGVRRIGMPPNVASPTANRSSYKPPSKRPLDSGGQGVARQALNDVTGPTNNIGPQPTAPDPKRQRLEDLPTAKAMSQ